MNWWHLDYHRPEVGLISLWSHLFRHNTNVPLDPNINWFIWDSGGQRSKFKVKSVILCFVQGIYHRHQEGISLSGFWLFPHYLWHNCTPVSIRIKLGDNILHARGWKGQLHCDIIMFCKIWPVINALPPQGRLWPYFLWLGCTFVSVFTTSWGKLLATSAGSTKLAEHSFSLYC